MKLKDYQEVERAAGISRAEVGRIGTAILFIVGVSIFTGTRFGYVEQAHLLIAAAVIGAYMAMNIGANDVANNVGPAVGSFAMTLTTAIAIAAFFEAVAQGRDGKMPANWVINDLFGRLKKDGRELSESPVSPAQLGGKVRLRGGHQLTAPVSPSHSL